jgi:hypothetical protein
MKKIIFLSICLVLLSNIAIAQTGNYLSGGTVQPDANIPTPYDGTTTIGAPGSSLNNSSDHNTLIGEGAGGSLSSGSQNLLLGTAAGALLSSGTDYNVIMGAFAADQTTGTSLGRNVIIGSLAARTLEGDDNIVIGYQAGEVMTIASDNVIIGSRAGESLTEGLDNIFIGESAGSDTTTGDDNVFIGDRSGYLNTIGEKNVFVGDYCGYRNTTGTSNTFLGGGSTESADGSGFYFGGNCGTDNTTGINNTFIGAGSGADNGVGTENTFIGAEAGARNELANFNTFIGYQAGVRNNISNNLTNASNNTFVGWRAGDRNEEGMNNVIMGYDAGFDNSDGTNNSVIIGYLARTTSATDRDNIVLLGANAISEANNAIAIGANTNISGNYSVVIGTGATTTANNSMVLGGVTATDRLSVGIATSTPNQNASLDLADVDKGFMVNRVTNAERTTMITAPASGNALNTADAGLMVYDTDDKLLYIWNGTQWGEVGSNAGSGVSAVPELLNYQSSVRDASGAILANQSVSFRMNVIDVTSGDTTVYSETHNVTTSDNGSVNFEIGGGTIVSGLFTDIDWSHNNSLQIELDAAGGTTYVVMGTTSFVSVPYALRAKYAENLTSSINAKMSDVSKDDKIQALETKVLALEKLVNQLINKN